MRFLVLIGLVAGALILGGVTITYRVLNHLNVFEDYASLHQGSCTPVIGVPGVEDIAADETLALAWLSSMDRPAQQKGEVVRGAIIAFDPDNPLDMASWRDRTGGEPETFEPLGIDLYEDDEFRRLFVVNAAGRNVLIYDVVADGSLKLAHTLKDPRLTTPNSIVAVGPKTFYITNSAQSSGGGLLSDIGYVFGSATGSILYYDGNSWSNAAIELKRPNGIEVSADGTKVYVAETSGKALSVFHRDIETGVIIRAGEMALNGFPDNLNRLEDGSLLLGLIPKPLAFSGHAGNSKKNAPSQVMKVRFSGHTEEMDLVFQDDGERLSGATTATQLGRKLLIGAYAENKFLLCN